MNIVLKNNYYTCIVLKNYYFMIARKLIKIFKGEKILNENIFFFICILFLLGTVKTMDMSGYLNGEKEIRILYVKTF